MAGTYRLLEWIIANYTVYRMVTTDELNMGKCVLDVEISWGNKKKDAGGNIITTPLGEEVWTHLFSQRFYLTAQMLADYLTDLATGTADAYRTSIVPNNVGNTAFEVKDLLSADTVMALPIYNFVAWAMNKGLLGAF